MRSWARPMRLVLLGLACLAAPSFLHADYDPAAEIQRLIANAKESRQKAILARSMAETMRNQLKQAYLQTNTSQQEVSQVLYQTRLLDARNKAMLTVKTGMLFKTVYDAATGSIVSAVVDMTVTAGSDYLVNHYPSVFDTQLTKTLPGLSDKSSDAVKKFNLFLGMSDQELSGLIRSEHPELAQDRGIQDVITGGKLSDDLIALYRARLIIEKGTETEKALQDFKRLLAEKQQQLLDVIAGIDREIKLLDEEIQSWEHNRELLNTLSNVPPPSPTAAVQPNWSARAAFSTAASQMHEALARLRANEVDCAGYQTLVDNAQVAADNQLSDQWQNTLRQHCPFGAWSSDGCVAARARFENTVKRDYEATVGGAQRWLGEQFAAEARDRVGPFGTKLRAILEAKLTVGDFGAMKTREYSMGALDPVTLAKAPFWNELALPVSNLDEWWNGEYHLPRGAPPLREQIDQNLRNATEHLRDLEHDKRLAGSARSETDAMSADVEQLAGQFEPNLRFWGCWGYSPDLFRSMRTFHPIYASEARTIEAGSERYLQAVRKRVGELQSLSSAYAAETGLLRIQEEAAAIAASIWALQADSGFRLNDPRIAYGLWSMLAEAGVNSAMTQELSETVDKLGKPEFAIQYHMELAAGKDPRRRPVLDAAQLQTLRAGLTRAAQRLVPVYNDYHSLYGQLSAKQRALDSGYGQLRRQVESTLGAEAPYLVAPMVLDSRYLMQPEDFPDPTAGVFELLERYAELAGRYHAIVDKMAPWTFPLLADLEKLRARLDKERGGAMGLGETAFAAWLNGFSGAASELAHKAFLANKTGAPAESPFARNLGELWGMITEIGQQYANAKRIAELAGELRRVADGVGKFLARPEFEGGPAAANDWSERLATLLAEDGEPWKFRRSGAIAPLFDTLSGYRERIKAYLQTGGDAAVRKLYEDFAAAYQARNLGGLLRFMSEDWKASDGSDLRDLEDVLDNSFRVFDRIEFALTGLSIRALGQGRYAVSYSVAITGHIHQLNLQHKESGQVEDVVVLTPSGAKIQATRGGRIWLQP